MQIAIGVVATLCVVAAFVALRLIQWGRRFEAIKSIKCEPEKGGHELIFLADHRDWSSTETSDNFQITPQLVERLDGAAEYYHQTIREGRLAQIILTTGNLAQAGIQQGSAVSFYLLRELARRGVDVSWIVPYRGSNGKGAADSFEEARLVCEYMGDWNFSSVTVVSDVWHVPQFFLLFAWRGFYARMHPVPLVVFDPKEFVGRIVSTLVTVFNPTGSNPLYAYERHHRRQPKAA